MVSVLDPLSAGGILLNLAVRNGPWPVTYGVAVFVASAVLLALWWA